METTTDLENALLNANVDSELKNLFTKFINHKRNNVSPGPMSISSLMYRGNLSYLKSKLTSKAGRKKIIKELTDYLEAVEIAEVQQEPKKGVLQLSQTQRLQFIRNFNRETGVRLPLDAKLSAISRVWQLDVLKFDDMCTELGMSDNESLEEFCTRTWGENNTEKIKGLI